MPYINIGLALHDHVGMALTSTQIEMSIYRTHTVIASSHDKSMALSMGHDRYSGNA